MHKDHPIVEFIIIALMFVMAIAGCHAVNGCTSSPSPSSAEYPFTQPIDPVTEEVINANK